MFWQSGSYSQIHKTIQAQSDIKAVHAQGTARGVQAQAEIIGITKRMETVAKRLTRRAAGGTYWKKAAIEQAGLLDKMLDVAKASENDLLIAAVRKVFDGWVEGNPHYRAASGSGMTISECLATALAGKQPEQKHAVSLMEEPTFWSAFWKRVARNLILPAIGCGLIAIIYTVAVGKATLHPQAIVSSKPAPETPMAVPATPAPTATPISERPAATPTPQAETPMPSVQARPTPSRLGQQIHGKPVRKRRATHS